MILGEGRGGICILGSSRDGCSYLGIHGYSEGGGGGGGRYIYNMYASWNHPGMAVVSRKSTDTLTGGGGGGGRGEGVHIHPGIIPGWR